MQPLAMSFMESGQVPASQPEMIVEAFDNQVLMNDRFHLSALFADDVSAQEARGQLKSQAEAFMLANAGGGTESQRSQKGFPESAEPELFNIGGGRRVLALLPEDTSSDDWVEKLKATFGNCVSSMTSEDQRALTVLCEVEGVSVETLLANFRHKNPRLSEVAARVHTRVDINF